MVRLSSATWSEVGGAQLLQSALSVRTEAESDLSKLS
jgi:hypothetical protein